MTHLLHPKLGLARSCQSHGVAAETKRVDAWESVIGTQQDPDTGELWWPSLRFYHPSSCLDLETMDQRGHTTYSSHPCPTTKTSF